METVLVVGSTGNIGTSAVSAALRSKKQVLAIVRSQSSADKLVKNVGTDEGITFAISDVASTTGIRSVVEQVKDGKLPAFQHVWSSGMLMLLLGILKPPTDNNFHIHSRR
jgi:NAD(P)-dependent dehydrogenase (short-subunit alcohol dehydrogenase family)